MHSIFVVVFGTDAMAEGVIVYVLFVKNPAEVEQRWDEALLVGWFGKKIFPDIVQRLALESSKTILTSVLVSVGANTRQDRGK